MKRGLWVLLCLLGLSALGAEPRAFAPVFLKLGALNEVYVWDELAVGSFRVEVRRPGQDKPVISVVGFSVDRPLAVLGGGNRPLKWSAALLALDPFETPGPVSVEFLRPDGSALARVSSEILPRSFPSENIALDKAMSDLRSKPNARKDKEAAEIWKLYQSFHPETTGLGRRFALPVPAGTPSSGQYGDIRHYLYADGATSRDYHRGTDFAVPVGTKVTAPAPAVVALVKDRFLTGTTIVLEHGPGVYSVYFHLSKAAVKKGQDVAAGALLGFSGATGLATGPHLHWELRIDGVPVDPLDFVTDGILDTEAVTAVISSVERSIH